MIKRFITCYNLVKIRQTSISQEHILICSTKRMIKTLNKIDTEETFLNVIKAIYVKPIANITLNEEKLKAFPLKLKQDKVSHFLHSLSTQYWKS